MAITHEVAKRSAAFLSILLMLMHFATGGVQGERRLPDAEVEALREIASELRKHDWNFTENPCDQNSSWTSPTTEVFNNSVICNCSGTDNECHVIYIFLKGQDLDGVLPASLAKLPDIKIIDLTRNYLSGSIPHTWASTQLEFIFVSANRLSGPIPNYLGNITTLKNLSIENNQFSGTVPPQLGELVSLERIILSANNLTGELPLELSNLVNLKEFRISSNNLRGRIPSFIQSWKQLQKLEIQGSGYEGPIPSSISLLQDLTELRISDLSGEGSHFPPLGKMKNMNYLMLRSCNISGAMPAFIADMAELRVLDLSFNKLEGNILNLDALTQLSSMFLASNLFSGPIPDWIKNKINCQIDLSYNNFSKSSVPPNCPSNLNLFKSFSEGNHLELAKCPKSSDPCSKDLYKLHINCGGPQTQIGDTIFEGDESSDNEAYFVPEKEGWGFSNTGRFWDHNMSISDYSAENVSLLAMTNSDLYTKARLSPLSLTYYGRCLANGNYTVTLHFAEIVFRANKSFQSLGRRKFDVYIQDNRVLKDFDIEKEAGGVDKAVVEQFKAVVKDKILVIHFLWTGKGTTMVPRRGNYGPIISAISVKSDFKPPSGRRKKLVVVGAAGLVLCLILMLLGAFWWKRCQGGQKSREQDLKRLDLQSGNFTLRQIKAATNNFDDGNKIGEGGFGSVYKGILLDGTTIAVKQLSAKSKQGSREFVNEIGIISALRHPNLVRLYGCCTEQNQLLLVYEYMENNSLARALFDSGPEKCQLKLDWPTRHRICFGIARGLAFLQEESAVKIVHRDIKATNVLLDSDLNPKISDFGLAKLDNEDNTHISTRVAGTIGYMAPEYALWGHLTYKADVYSFGVVVLEIVAGKNNQKYQHSEDRVSLLDWAYDLQAAECLVDLVDPKLESAFNKEEAMTMIKVALLCTNSSPELRPTMSTVVSMLEGQTTIPKNSSNYGDNLRCHYDQFQLQSSSGTQISTYTSDSSCLLSSTADGDLDTIKSDYAS